MSRVSILSIALLSIALLDHADIITFVFQDTALLATLTHPSHRFYKHTVHYAFEGSLSCRRTAS